MLMKILGVHLLVIPTVNRWSPSITELAALLRGVVCGICVGSGVVQISGAVRPMSY